MDAVGASVSTPRPVASETTGVRGLGWLWTSIVRGLSLFLGLFLVAGLVGSLRHDGSQESLWLFDAGGVPGPEFLGAVLLALAGLVLLAHGVRPAAGGRRRALTVAVFAALTLVALLNVLTFYRVWAAGDIDPRVPLPLSLPLAALMAWCAWATARGPAAPAARPRAPVRGAAVLLTVAACVFLFPLAQIVFFGTTDYRRPADVAVVFGAQVHPGGVPSSTLTWRVDTACELYREGLVDRLVMSGAVGDSGYDEALVMRDMAIDRGVLATAIEVDSRGVNT